MNEHYAKQNSSSGFYILVSDATNVVLGRTGRAGSISTVLSKQGASENSVSPTITEIGGGVYWVAPLTAHRDTLGSSCWRFTDTGSVIAPRFERIGLADHELTRFGASVAGDQMRLVSGTGTGELLLTAGTVTVGTNNDKTNYGLSSGERSVLYAGIQSQLDDDFASIASSLTTINTGIASLQTSVNNLTNFTSVGINVVEQVEIPDSGTETIPLIVRTYDLDAGQDANADTTPTLQATFPDGSNATSTIGLVFVNNPSTGEYRWNFNCSSSDPSGRHVRFKVITTMNGRTYTTERSVQWVNAVAVDFTSSDRTLLNSINTFLSTQIGNNGQSLSQIPWNAAWDAEVQSEATDALTAYGTSTTTNVSDLSTLVTTLSNKFAGITSQADWLRNAFRSDTPTAGMIAALAEINAGGGTFAGVSHSIQRLRTAIDGISGGGTLSGPYVATITITESSLPLQNVYVLLSDGVNTETKLTDINGQVTFSVSNATWSIRGFRSGYSTVQDTIVINNGNNSKTIAITKISVSPPSDPTLTTVYFLTVSASGIVQPNIPVTIELLTSPTADTGRAWDSDQNVLTSNGSGLIELPLPKGSTIRIYREGYKDTRYTIPVGAGSTYQLPSFVGKDIS